MSDLEQQAESILRQQGLTPERTGEEGWNLAVRDAVNKLAGATAVSTITRNPSPSRSRGPAPVSTFLPPLTEERRAEKAERLERHRLPEAPPDPLTVERDSCEVCLGVRFIRVTADRFHPLFGEAVPCHGCSTGFPLEERMRRAEIPAAYQSMTFETFDVSLNPTGREVVAWDGKSNLVLAGNTGTGKTHLAVAALNREIEKRQRIGRFIAVKRLLEEIRRRYNDDEGLGSAQTYMDSLAGWPVLVLDDMGVERTTPWVIEQMTDLIDRRVAAGHTTIITTNLSTAEDVGKHYGGGITGSRIASRLGARFYTWIRSEGMDARQYAP